jgi:adhesin HecA-like repeat protein
VGGKIYSHKTLTLNVENINNQNETFKTYTYLKNNDGSSVDGGQALGSGALYTNNANGYNGSIGSGGDMTIAGKTLNNSGTIAVGGNLHLDVDKINNKSQKNSYIKDATNYSQSLLSEEKAGIYVAENAYIKANNYNSLTSDLKVGGNATLLIKNQSYESLGLKNGSSGSGSYSYNNTSKGEKLATLAGAAAISPLLYSVALARVLSGKTKTTTSTYWEQSTTDYLHNTIDVGGDLYSKGDSFNAIGLDLTTGGSATIIAKNISIAGTTDTSYEKTVVVEKTKKVLSSKTTTTTTIDESGEANQSNLVASGGLTLISEGDIELVGVNQVSKEGDIIRAAGYKVAEDGSLEKSGIKADVKEYALEDYRYSDTTVDVKKRGVSKDTLKSAWDSAKQNTIIGGLEKTMHQAKGGNWGNALNGTGASYLKPGASIAIELGSNSKTREIVKNNYVNKSFVAAGEGHNITTLASGDILSKGTDFSAQKDENGGGKIKFKADGDVKLLQQNNRSEYSKTTEEEKISYTASVGNSYLDVANTALNASLAGAELFEAEKNLLDTKKAYERGEISYSAYQEEVASVATMAATYALSTSIGAISGVASLALSAPAAGFYASNGLKFDKTTTKESQSSTTGVGSNFNADSIIIEAGGDATLQGSFNAKENISLVGENIKIKAIESKSSSSFKSNSTSVSISVGTNGVSGGADFSSSKNTSNSTSYENAQINAGGIISITSKADTQIYGGNIKGNDVILDIGKDLELKSMQNTSSSKGSSQGFGVNGSLNSAGGHINMGKSSSDMAKVEEQSSIIGTNSVKGNVAGTFTNEGGLIGNIRQEGDKLIDGGNMELRANKIINKEVQNISNSQSSGWGFNANVGLGDDAKKQEDANKGSTLSPWQKGSMGASASKNESTTSSTTYGTIGSGLIVANTIEGNINRDVNNLTSEEKTIINHNLNANLQIDTRVLSTAGREEIKRDFKASIEQADKAINMAVKSGQKIAQITVAGANVVINGIQEMSKSDIERAVNTSVVAVDYYKETGKMLSFEEQVKIQAQDQGITLSDEDIANAMNQFSISENSANLNNVDTQKKGLFVSEDDALYVRKQAGTGDGKYDPEGSGRKNKDKTPRGHYGVDLLVEPGTSIYSPTDGILSNSVPDTKNKANYGGTNLELKGGKITTKDGVEINIFYMQVVDQTGNPVDKVNRQVKKGDQIGVAQDMASIYNYNDYYVEHPNKADNERISMDNHIHFEVKYRDGKKPISWEQFDNSKLTTTKNNFTFINPADYFPNYKFVVGNNKTTFYDKNKLPQQINIEK